MTTVGWLVVVIAGLALLLKGSSEAVTDAVALTRGTRLPPFFIGVTLLAIGTDLPEIANSLVASFTDNGDINVGDSIGSTLTQLTLVLGLLPFLARDISLGESGSKSLRGQQGTLWLTVAALLLLTILLLDDHIGHVDALLLLTLWAGGSRFLFRTTRSDPQLPITERAPNRGRILMRLCVAVLAIGGGATLAVTGITELAELWGVPQFLIAFFGVSIGTSLPELIVDITALRRGESGLAIGDVLGSSFVDSTLSISAGPLLFPTVVDGDLARSGVLVTAGAAVIVALLLARGGQHDRRNGAILLLVYAGSWPILL